MLWFIIFCETFDKYTTCPVSTTMALDLSRLLLSMAKSVAFGKVDKFVQGCEIIILFSLLPEIFMNEHQQKEDCYFYTDISLPQNEQEINVLCVNCYKNGGINGWLWEGSRLGYGPFDFTCKKCGHEIHKKGKK